MNAALTCIEKILNQSISENKFFMTGESRIKIILIAFSGITSIFSIGFFVYGSYIWLNNNYDTVTTMVAMGGMFSLLSIISATLVYNITLYKRKKIQAEKENFISNAKDAFEIFQQDIEKPVTENPKSSLLIAAILGYLAGEKLL